CVPRRACVIPRSGAQPPAHPYATLFRSECHFPIGREESCRVCHQDEPQHETATDQPAWHVPGMNCRLCHLPAGPGPGGAPPVPQDRKSTRLNSSHVKTSYAVFCLKKKTN